MIDSLYAFITDGADGTEQVVGGTMPDGSQVPLIARDEARMVALIPVAQSVANFSGYTLRVARFDRAESDIAMVIEPAGGTE